MAHRSKLSTVELKSADAFYEKMRGDLLTMAETDPHVFELLRRHVAQRFVCDDADSKGHAKDRLKEGDISGKLEPNRRYRDGAGLVLNVSKSGGKNWTFTYSFRGKEREMGLGSFLKVSLPEARAKAAEARTLLGKGIDPIAEVEKTRRMARKAANRATFGEAANALIEAKSHEWTNEKHAGQWRATLETYCRPIWKIPVDEIDTDTVCRVLSPIWTTKIETAKRLRGRIENILDYAKVRGWRSGENPAKWRGHLDNILATPSKVKGGRRGPQRSLPYSEMPAFIIRLRDVDTVSALALEFLALTAVRSGEVLGATWSEIDLEQKTWVIPSERTKTKKGDHKVPLSDGAVSILRKVEKIRSSNFVFPGQRRDKPLSEMAMEMVMRRLNVDATPHGFRASFRTWASEATDCASEIAESALGHVIRDKVQAVYNRTTFFNKRRALMDLWASHLDPATKKNAPNS